MDTEPRPTAGPTVDARLSAALGASPPDSVRTLAEADRAALADLLEDAQAQQLRSLEETFDATLRHVPFPLRKIVKKVLLG